MRLLTRGVGVKAIGDFQGHRDLESTCCSAEPPVCDDESSECSYSRIGDSLNLIADLKKTA
jgi:hypothetical protein